MAETGEIAADPDRLLVPQRNRQGLREVARAEGQRMQTVLGMARAKNLIPRGRPA